MGQDERDDAASGRRLNDLPNPRLAEITKSLIRHLHEFVAEVDLTREEWFAGIEALTRTGQMCDDQRQEFILLSDTIGVSMLVEMINHVAAEGSTEPTVFGPFHVDGATLDVWETASNGFYDVQDGEQTPMNMRGIFTTRSDGVYEIKGIRPVLYQIPGDGTAGDLLFENGRHNWRPGHMHFVVAASGHKTVITHLFDAASGYLDSDAVFGVRDSLIVDMSGDRCNYDFVLEPASAN